MLTTIARPVSYEVLSPLPKKALADAKKNAGSVASEFAAASGELAGAAISTATAAASDGSKKDE